jgi:ABC-type transport system involved in multi-copper enzyme maturation permease subunit
MRFLSIIQLTFRESLAKKTFLAFFGISTLICLLFIFALNLDIVNGMQSSISIFGAEMPEQFNIQDIIIKIQSIITGLLFTGGIFMSIFATSGLMPTLLQPGFIDLFISKPVSRLQIITGRFVGATAIVALNIFYLVIFSGLILFFKTGIWNWSYLLAGLIIVLTFMILYTLMILFSILTKSSAFSIMLTYFIIFLSPLLIPRDQIYALLSSKFYAYLLDGLYYFLPKTSEIAVITGRIAGGQYIGSWMPLWSSILFAMFIFSVSAYLFQRKNF